MSLVFVEAPQIPQTAAVASPSRCHQSTLPLAHCGSVDAAMALRGRRFHHQAKLSSSSQRKKSNSSLSKNEGPPVSPPSPMAVGVNTDLSLLPQGCGSKLARPVWPRSTPTIPSTFYKNNLERSVRIYSWDGAKYPYFRVCCWLD